MNNKTADTPSKVKENTKVDSNVNPGPKAKEAQIFDKPKINTQHENFVLDGAKATFTLPEYNGYKDPFLNAFFSTKHVRNNLSKLGMVHFGK